MKQNFFLAVMIFVFSLNSYSQTLIKSDIAMLLATEVNSINVFQSSVDSVVNVSNIIKIKNIFPNIDTEIESVTASGFVWDKEGHIITNFHVVDGGSSFLVTFKNNNKHFSAKLIGADPIKDIAVLKLVDTFKELKPVALGDSKSLLVGQKALAIGCPLGLNHTLTIGTISAIERRIKGYSDISIDGMIQTDASINPGNSGGILLDSLGKVMGMNSILYNASGGQSSAGIGFAIPVNTVKQIVPQLIKFGKIFRPGLGMSFLEDFFAIRIGLKEGVMIKSIHSKKTNANLDLRGIAINIWGQYTLGDVIVGIGPYRIKNNDDLFSILQRYKIGDKVKLKYLRDKVEKVVDVKLISM